MAPSNHTDARRAPHRPTNDRLATMEPWQATALAVGLLALVVPLMILPGFLARALDARHPVPTPHATATVGIALSLCTFMALSRLVRVPLADVFVRPPDRSTVRWGMVGLLLAGTVVAATVLALDGTLVVARLELETVVGVAVLAVLVGTWTATLEEVALRGYLLSVVGHQWHWPGAIAVTSALFGLFHNAHADEFVGTLLYVGCTGLAGLTLAGITYYTGNVSNAVAIHATWNALFSDHLLVVRTASEPPTEALVTYVLADVPLLFGGEYAAVTESPVAIATFAVAATAVFAYYRVASSGSVPARRRSP